MTQKILLIFLFSCVFLFAENAQQPQRTEPKVQDYSGFETEDSFIDVDEAIRSRQYVRRAVLASAIKSSSRFSFSRFYINHLMGYNAVLHRGTQLFTKYESALLGLSVGYITDGGIALEGGIELSAISDAFVGMRYVMRPQNISLWPFIGAGLGTEISAINFSDRPLEAKSYTGPTQMGFLTAGLLIPIVDVGIKAEARGIFYGVSRLSLVTGVGVVIFL